MKRGAKLAIIIVCVLLAALVAAIIIVNVGEGKTPKGPDTKGSITYFYDAEQTVTRFAVNDEMLENYIAGTVDTYITVDGSVALVRAGTGLYRVDSEGVLMIYPAAVQRAVLSLDNKHILFCTVTQAFVYDHETGELTEIEGLGAKNVLNLAISPSGETFGVTVVDDAGVAKTYVYRNGELKMLNADSCLIAISDDGEFAYYMEALGRELTGRLFAVKNGEDSLIAENVSSYFEINNDLSEITFDIKEKTHYSVNGKPAKQLADASILMSAKGCFSSMGGDGCPVLLRDLNTIFNCVYYTYYTVENANSQTMNAYSLYYVSGAHKATLLVEGAVRFSVNAERDSVLCIVDGDLYKVTSYAPNRPTLIARSVHSFTATDDFEDIYVLDQYARLAYIDGAKSTSLAANVSSCMITKDGICLFVTDYEDNEGSLKWAKGTEIGDIADGVYNFETYAGITFYYAATDESEEKGVFSVYMSNDSKKFELAVEKAQLKKSE